jgi:hypothetical protein
MRSSIKRMQRRARVMVVLALLLGGPGADAPGWAQEPVRLSGMWTGTWWMGKYEEPIELELIQTGTTLSGGIAIFGYPEPDWVRSGGAGRNLSEAPVPVTGQLDGDRIVLAWPMSGGRHFRATLTVGASGALFGLGGEGDQIAFGLELTRVQ